MSAADLKAQAKAAKAAEKAAKKAAKKGGGAPSQDGEKKGGKKKRLIIIVLAVVLVAVAVFVLKGRGSSGPAEPVPGAVVTIDPIYVNLTDGHYLKLGLALQASAAAPKDLDGAKALDVAIETFSGRSMEELASAKTRSDLKESMNVALEEAYEGEVLEVYFTEFVMQ